MYNGWNKVLKPGPMTAILVDGTLVVRNGLCWRNLFEQEWVDQIIFGGIYSGFG